MRSTHFEEHDHHGEMPVRFKAERTAPLQQKRGKNDAKPKAKGTSAN